LKYRHRKVQSGSLKDIQHLNLEELYQMRTSKEIALSRAIATNNNVVPGREGFDLRLVTIFKG